MTDSSRDIRWRRGWAVTARAAAIVLTAASAALAAACDSNPSPGPGGSPGSGESAISPSMVAYSACMRSHGLPNYPDPDTSGQLPKTDAQALGVSTSQFETAQQACRRLLPTGGSLAQREHQCMEDSDCPPARVQQMLNADLKLSRCMRSHGLPNFPDPTNGGASGPVFNITKAGISDAASHAPEFIARLNECERLVGADAPQSFE